LNRVDIKHNKINNSKSKPKDNQTSSRCQTTVSIQQSRSRTECNDQRPTGLGGKKGTTSSSGYPRSTTGRREQP